MAIFNFYLINNICPTLATPSEDWQSKRAPPKNVKILPSLPLPPPAMNSEWSFTNKSYPSPENQMADA